MGEKGQFIPWIFTLSNEQEKLRKKADEYYWKCMKTPTANGLGYKSREDLILKSLYRFRLSVCVQNSRRDSL